jgi:AraC-like DNA-binding protein
VTGTEPSRIACRPLRRIIAALPGLRYQKRAPLRDCGVASALLDTHCGVNTIALQLGFASQSHLIAAFHRTVGVPAVEFRRQANRSSLGELRTTQIARLYPQS